MRRFFHDIMEKETGGSWGNYLRLKTGPFFSYEFCIFHDSMKKSGPTLAGPIIFRQNRGRFFHTNFGFFHDGPVR